MAHWTVAILPQCLMGSLWRPSKAPIIIGIGKIILCCDNFINLQWTMTIYNIIMKDEQLHQTITFSIGKWCDKLNNDQSHLVWDELRLIEISQICYVCNFVLKRSCMVLFETSVPRSIHWFIITLPFKAYAILIPKQRTICPGWFQMIFSPQCDAIYFVVPATPWDLGGYHWSTRLSSKSFQVVWATVDIWTSPFGHPAAPCETLGGEEYLCGGGASEGWDSHSGYMLIVDACSSMTSKNKKTQKKRLMQ